jgi:uncharacterized protein YdhG (YjbR/CyaY superfamily)
MATARAIPKSIDDYIAGFPPTIQSILRRIRATIRKAAPDATEGISYAIPCFKLEGALVYFAAFRQHIGLYPPVRGDSALEKAVARYAGEKGNLRFPLDQPIPYALIDRIVKLRVKQNLATKAAPARPKRTAKPKR